MDYEYDIIKDGTGFLKIVHHEATKYHSVSSRLPIHKVNDHQQLIIIIFQYVIIVAQ